MPGYADFHSDAEKIYHARQYRRRRAIAGIRGALRMHHSPRWITFFCFLASAIPGLAGTFLAYNLGMNPWGTAPAIGILLMWPSFVFISFWVANNLFQSDKLLADFKDSVLIDSVAEGWENARAAGYVRTERDRQIATGIEAGLRAGGGNIITVIPMVLISFGTWLVWDLARYGPTLLAEMIVDGCLIRKFPKIQNLFFLEDWRYIAFVATSIHFVLLSFVVLALGKVLQSLLPILRF